LGRTVVQTWFRSLVTKRPSLTATLLGIISSAGKQEMAKREPTSLAMTTKVLFVCMGNICRSPMAEGVFRTMVKQSGLEDVVTVDSAGTHAFHIGEAPDKRAQNISAKRGYDLTQLRGRQIQASDFEEYDYILAMDWENLALLQQQAPKSAQHKLQLLMRFATEHESATIPDPYYGGPQGFETVLDYVEDASNGLLEVCKRRATQVAAA
jgi:protein-tyrosine phosphatase